MTKQYKHITVTKKRKINLILATSLNKTVIMGVQEESPESRDTLGCTFNVARKYLECMLQLLEVKNSQKNV